MPGLNPEHLSCFTFQPFRNFLTSMTGDWE
nr:MAG TPA: hypothetical protein [Caudoviricetes sp.]